jgi:hypothetical protein
VAVRTPHFAFRDLFDDQIPRHCAVYQATYVGALVAQVVKVQNIRF